ncbi:N-acetylmuramoyl-L-alanine amidase [Lewinella sp. W8]|uniref:N-acetylmuramoyl-L-alanine amidase n=1 Tax=Lewinella sp. W8 TaxID=2528208 RepID=UPI0010685A6C|nr:N-acetylmuramoyl-L-alanine amidase [Lewinella sp. W8]MTB51545.1 N-acetylmuramoyl-L-alanine amidase [Lewinella sp. W8]
MPLVKTLVFLGLMIASMPLSADHLRVAAQRGDGIYSLLRRYALLNYGCNLEEFYRLNQLRKNANLLVGREYKLPIEVYTYNGKSIRTTTENEDYTRALAIQHYNEGLLEAGVRQKDFREDKVLYVPFHIDNCIEDAVKAAPREITDQGEITRSVARTDSLLVAPEQVTTSAYRTFGIFGPDKAFVPKLDDKLAGRIFYIVSGHGGPDPGAIGRRAGHYLHEDEYAYDVALRLTRNILAHGGTPYMIVRDNDGIRDDEYLKGDKDETVWGGAKIPVGQKNRLTQRSEIINALYEENLAKGITDQTMVAIHVDSRAKGKRIDLFFYHYEGDLLGAKQAEIMHQTIRNKYDKHQRGRGYTGTLKSRDLHMLRETKPSGVYVELANITNPVDQLRIVSPRNRQLLADWLAEGLIRR